MIHNGSNYMKRLCIIIMVFTLLLLGRITAFGEMTGSCGDNLTWTINDSGTLIITGTGAMPDYHWVSNRAPWYPYRDDIYSVHISDGVLSIGSYAFYDCYNIDDVCVGNDVITINVGAFSSAEALSSVTLNNNLKSIGDSAFLSCSNLETIVLPSSLEEIGNGAFQNCNLTSIIIPPSITTIGNQAFQRCANLNTIDVDPGNMYYSSDNGVLLDKIQSAVICCPNGFCGHYSIPRSVKCIKDSAFSDCVGLTSISIPNGVTTIEYGAFWGCVGLSEVVFPDSLQSVGSHAFHSCQKITSITIPQNVTAIGSEVFSGCSKLRSIFFAGDLPAVGEGITNNTQCAYLFFNYGNNTYTYASLPDYYPIHYIWIGIDEDGVYHGFCNESVTWTYDDGIFSINGYGGMTNYTKYSDPPCPWSKLKQEITSVIIGNEITSIGNYSFCSMQNLISITIPESVTRIGDYALSNCNSLKYVFYSGTETKWNHQVSVYSTNASLQSALFHYNSTAHTLENVVTEPTCTEPGRLGEICIYPNCDYSVSESSIPVLGHSMKKTESREATCTEEGYEAYWECERCNKLFSDETGKNEIETPIEIPKTGHIWGEASYIWSTDNRSLTATHTCINDNSHVEEETVTVSADITSPTENNRGSASYTSETFSSDGFVVKRKNIAIPMLRNMSVMYLPEMLTTIEAEAFAGVDCEAFIIPNNCASVGPQAFANCRNLLYVSAPANVIIDPTAFDGCVEVIIDTFTE